MLPGAGRSLFAQLLDDGGAQAWLVALDGHHVPGAGTVEQAGGAVLCVQRIQGEHHRCDVVPGGGQVVQER